MRCKAVKKFFRRILGQYRGVARNFFRVGLKARKAPSLLAMPLGPSTMTENLFEYLKKSQRKNLKFRHIQFIHVWRFPSTAASTKIPKILFKAENSLGWCFAKLHRNQSNSVVGACDWKSWDVGLSLTKMKYSN